MCVDAKSSVFADAKVWIAIQPVVTTLQMGSYSKLDSNLYGIPYGNHIEDRPVYLVYYR